MIDVLQISFGKDQLDKLPAEERGLFLLLGHAANQINVLYKWIIVSTNRTPDDPVEQRVTGAQTQIIVRLLIGVIREAWSLIQGRLLQEPLKGRFLPMLDTPAREALGRLEGRADELKLLVAIRGGYGFHHPTAQAMEKAYRVARDNQDGEPLDWAIYLSRNQLNNFFFVSDFVIAHGMTNTVNAILKSRADKRKEVFKPLSAIRAHEEVLKVLTPVSFDLSEVAFGFAAAIFKKVFGPELSVSVAAKITGAPVIDDAWFPFYFEYPE